MMQRSDPLLAVLALGGTGGAYVFAGWPGAALVGGALGLGVVVGLVATRGAPKAPPTGARPRTRVVRSAAAARGPARPARASTAHASVVALRPGARGPAMEPGHARIDPLPDNLRLTGDILRGMHTGGKTTRGRCSRCDSVLWLSARRPLKATCPVCGFSRVLA